jgi:type IV pilus assembly protein PilA
MKIQNSKGFTLIELLIVVAIIAILAAIAIPQFSAYRERAVLASMIADARNIATAEEAYFGDYMVYLPTTIATAGGAGTLGSQNISMSKGNTLVVTSSTSSYSITVSNAGLSTASKNVVLTGPGGTCTKPSGPC